MPHRPLAFFSVVDLYPPLDGPKWACVLNKHVNKISEIDLATMTLFLLTIFFCEEKPTQEGIFFHSKGIDEEVGGAERATNAHIHIYQSCNLSISAKCVEVKIQ